MSKKARLEEKPAPPTPAEAADDANGARERIHSAGETVNTEPSGTGHGHWGFGIGSPDDGVSESVRDHAILIRTIARFGLGNTQKPAALDAVTEGALERDFFEPTPDDVQVPPEPSEAPAKK